jgi:hypothetical protein
MVRGRPEHLRQDKNLLYWHDEPKEPNMERRPLPAVRDLTRAGRWSTYDTYDVL